IRKDESHGSRRPRGLGWRREGRDSHPFSQLAASDPRQALPRAVAGPAGVDDRLAHSRGLAGHSPDDLGRAGSVLGDLLQPASRHPLGGRAHLVRPAGGGVGGDVRRATGRRIRRLPDVLLAVYVFSPRISAVVVAALTLGVVTILVGHIGWNIGAVTGPSIGAAVAWTLGVGFQLLHREATAKARALDALVAAREDALASSRKAGEADERMRLAGDIHDTVAQGLSSIHMLLTAVESQLAGSSPAGTSEAGGEPDSGGIRVAAQHRAGQPEIEAVHQRMLTQVRLARTTASENLAETRRIIAALQPAPLDGAAL